LRSQRAHERKVDAAGREDSTERLGSETALDDQAQRAKRAMQSLPPKQREAVALVFFENCTHAEAALRLGCAESTVSWRIFLAKRTLRKWLTP
jgi:RNA polymerase sigma-70 factor (ECF subfamily)